jgi:hypothetical protein
MIDLLNFHSNYKSIVCCSFENTSSSPELAVNPCKVDLVHRHCAVPNVIKLFTVVIYEFGVS